MTPAARGAHRIAPNRLGVLLVTAGALLSATALLVTGLSGRATPASLAARVMGLPPTILPAADTPVSSSSPPVSVAIPAIAVSSMLEGLRLNGDGSLQTPRDPSRAGWYSDGPAPGDRGAAVFVGHLDSRTGPAVFWRLSTLVRGDLIYVTRADGRTLTFVVDHSGAFPRTDLPTGVVYGAQGPELHLITCNGTYQRSIGRYDHSLVVVAKLAAESTVAAPVVTPTVAPLSTLSPGPTAPTSRSSGARAPSGTPSLKPRPTPTSTGIPSPRATPTPSPSVPPTPTSTPTPTPTPLLPLPSASAAGAPTGPPPPP